MGHAALEKFRSYLDVEKMRVLFQERLPVFSQGKLDITQCRVDQFRFRPIFIEMTHKKAPVSVVYKLHITDKRNQKHGVQLLYGKVYFEGRSQIRFRKAKMNPLSLPRFGEALAYLSDLDMVVWAFPNDPVLTCLPEVIDPKQVKEYFPYAQLPKGLNEPRDITEFTTKVVHYRPESHCTMRYCLKWQGLDKPEVYILYGKIFKNDEGKGISQWTQNLWEQFSADPAACRVPRPLGYSERVKTTWQEDVQGVSLISLIDEANYKDYMKAIVNGLVSLHASDCCIPPETGVNDRLEGLKMEIKALGSIFPEYRKTLQSILTRLEKTAPHLTSITDRLIHGDFHIQQLFSCGGQITFLDFDDLAMGDPMQDLAKFMVDLHFHDIDPGLVKSISMGFFHAYQSQAIWDVPIDRLTWHIELQCLKKASRRFLEDGVDLQDIVHSIELAGEIVLEINNVGHEL